MQKWLLVSTAIYGALGVGLGAFGAHGLKARWSALADGADRLGWWQTAVQYHLVHALALGVVAWIAGQAPGTGGKVAGICFGLGVLLFSGSLYVMALTGQRWLGAVTPLGGLLFIAGWLTIAVMAFKIPG